MASLQDYLGLRKKPEKPEPFDWKTSPIVTKTKEVVSKVKEHQASRPKSVFQTGGEFWENLLSTVDTTVKLPGKKPEYTGDPLTDVFVGQEKAGRDLFKFLSGVPGGMLRDIGQLAGDISSPERRKGLVESAIRVGKDPFKWENIDEPIVNFALTAPDFLPGGWIVAPFMAGGLKMVGKEGAEKLVKEAGEKVAKEATEKVTKESAEKARKEVVERIAGINLDRLKLSDEGKTQLRNQIDELKPLLEEAKGKTLSHDEILTSAKESQLLRGITTRDQMLVEEAGLLRTRQAVTEVSNKIARGAKVSAGEWQDYLEAIRTIGSQATQKGRALEALKIGAEGKPMVQQMIEKIIKIGNDADKVIDKAKGVDFTNQKEATKFYREFVQPSTSEIIDEWRYASMLSNPRTHIRNAFSNLFQTYFTKPATMLVEQGPVATTRYLKGTLKGYGKGADDFIRTLKGEMPITKPDLDFLPTGKLPSVFQIPGNAMEANDKFFSALIKEGMLASGATEEVAEQTAKYSLFRAGLDLTGKEQGYLLRGIDSLTNWAYKMPKGLRWMVPFIKTPMNFVKQFLEYSPVGLLTIPGAKKKKAQLAKAMVGSAVTAWGARLVADGKVTLSAPKGEAEKQAFYASGRRPFSINVGGKWVPMLFAGPMAFALVLPAIVHEYSKGEKSDLTTDKKLQGVAGDLIKFVTNQTPLSGINNLVKMASGDIDTQLTSSLAFTTSQAIPFSGLIRYIASIVDPVYRKAKGFKEGILRDLPITSKQLEFYTNPDGSPSTRNLSAYLAPYTTGTEDKEMEGLLDTYAEVSRLRGQAKERTTADSDMAEKVWEEIAGLSRNDQLKKLNEYKQSGEVTQNVYQKIKDLKKSSERDWATAEKKVYLLGPIEEAQFHWNKIRTMSREEQLKYLQDLKDRDLLTRQTYEQIQILKRNED